MKNNVVNGRACHLLLYCNYSCQSLGRGSSLLPALGVHLGVVGAVPAAGPPHFLLHVKLISEWLKCCMATTILKTLCIMLNAIGVCSCCSIRDIVVTYVSCAVFCGQMACSSGAVVLLHACMYLNCVWLLQPVSADHCKTCC